MKRKILAVVSTLVLFLVLCAQEYGEKVLTWTMQASLVIVILYGMFVAPKVNASKGKSLEVSGQSLLLINRDGSIVESIDISKPYTINASTLVYPEVLFKLKQDSHKMEFSTLTKNSEHIVKEVLKMKGEYPPASKWQMPW